MEAIQEKSTLNRIGTGVKVLDKMLCGGIPEKSQILLLGEAGSGKTLLSFQIAYEAARKGIRTTYLTIEEKKKSLIEFADILKSEGLAEIESCGLFDPYRHEVLMTKESEEKEGTILITVRKGYMWKEVMLRPASVVVSKGKGSAADKQEKKQ